MWHRFLADQGFYIGDMFEQAADRHGAVPVTLDRTLDVAPDTGLEHTYRTMADLVSELSARLWAAGVRPSERVAVYKTNNVDIALLACAASRIGAVPALLSPTLDGDVAAELLRRLETPWLVTDRATLELTSWGSVEGKPALWGSVGGKPAPWGSVEGKPAQSNVRVGELTRRVLLVGAGADRATTGAAVPLPIAGSARPRPVHLAVREPCLITHSSGTTGIPKLAVHCPEALWNRLVPQKLLGWPTRGETAAVCMSYVHSRFYHALGVFLHHGSPLLALVEHDPERVAPLLAKARPGVVETHPNTFVLWEELADAPGAPLASVRSYGSTFDAIHPSTVRRLLGASTRRGARLVQLYGQSETGPVAAGVFTRRSAGKDDGRLVGIALPGFTRIRVVDDDDGRPCPRGVPGHIEARTRGRILTYLGADDAYARQLDGAWWRMGDVGTLGRWGALRLVDREIDRIDTVDSNLELEDLLLSRLTELREIVIVPGPDGEPVPVVCTRDDRPLSLDRWHNAVAGLPRLADPVLCRFDELPRTGTWKIKRVEISRMFAEGRSLATSPAVAG